MNEAKLLQLAEMAQAHPSVFDMSAVVLEEEDGLKACLCGFFFIDKIFGGDVELALQRPPEDIIHASFLETETRLYRARLGLGMPNEKLFDLQYWPDDLLEKYRLKTVTIVEVVQNYIDTNGWPNG